MTAASSIILSIVTGQGFDDQKAAAFLLMGCIYTVHGPDGNGNGNGNGAELSGDSSHFSETEEAEVRQRGRFEVQK